MSLVLYGNGVVDNRGSVGGSTYSRSRAGATIRAKTSPTQWKSDLRQQAKGKLATISQQWANILTDAERVAWNSFALITPSTNVFGQTTYLSGQSWFCKCNVNLLNAGATLLTAPPASPSVPGLISLTIVPDSSAGGSVGITYTDAGLPADFYLSMKFTQPISPGIYYVNNLLRQILYAHNQVSGFSITTPYTDRFPQVVYDAGRKVFALATIIDSTSGIESPPIMASGIVV